MTDCPSALYEMSATPVDPLDSTGNYVKPDRSPAAMAVKEQDEAEPQESQLQGGEPVGPESLVSFKEESSRVSDLGENEKTALGELRRLVREALEKGQLAATSNSRTSETPKKSVVTDVARESKVDAGSSDRNEVELPHGICIWGIPLLQDDRTDVILLKFLRARDFKVRDAFAMMRDTLLWREKFRIDELVEDDLGDDLEKVVFVHGKDREGHLVCYNVYGEFQNRNLYESTFSNPERRTRFLRWRVQLLEKSIRKLDFTPGGIPTVFQVNDLRNAPGLGNKDLRAATNQALCLLQDNYPEFVAKQVFVNVPWWYVAFHTMISPFLTQRTKSKFVFAGPSKSAETLFKYISPEQVPIQYGGLSVDPCDCNPHFSLSDPATEILIMPGTKQIVEILVSEKCVIAWEIRVLGWDVTYAAEFIPDDTESSTYTVVVRKSTRMSPKHEPVVHESFNITDLGKLKLTIDNPTSKKKKLLYRFITHSTTD